VVGFLELVVIAATAQLAVLPGEKGQFIVAALSTRYHPLMVVAAATSAFAGWTVLELLFGAALQGALPPWMLDAVTALLFLLFAVMLYRSAPAPGSFDGDAASGTLQVAGAGGTERTGDDGAGDDVLAHLTDGGVVSEDLELRLAGREFDVPQRFGGFVPIFMLMAAGEFGDKTQLVTVGLAVQYGAHPAIWAGEMAAIVPVSLANAYVFHRFAGRFDVRKAHYAGAALFLFFGLDTVLGLATGFSVWEFLVGEVAAALMAVS
jgi:putative Ca2+/H+ antiporter (TMEM165/GDT1 family)